MFKKSLLTAAGHLGLTAVMLFVCAGVVISQGDKVKIDKEAIGNYKAKNKEFCSHTNWSNSEKVSVADLREMNVASTGSLAVDAGRNGGIKIKGENRSDVLLRACVQAWGISDEAARGLAASIRINTAGGMVKAEGPSEEGWSVSYEARVPHNTNLKLNAHNGGISIGSVDGNLEFETLNGGVSLVDVAGDVRGRTTNGGVNVSLSGSSWKGAGLDVQTTNGGVNLMLPEGYAANVETGTVNGGLRSDIPALNVTTEDEKGGWANRSKQINTAINGGGPPIRVVTRNGGIKIGTTGRN
ncbi:MAG: hypothetical protein AB7Q37_16415 [Pyrinomonadaceae bacterium]